MTEADGTYRGFLFADLRGYSADVERYGDRAAANLLDDYRALVRAQVAEHAGAEIKTEGDSFYVVFPSAQRAVRCALAILAAAASHNRAGDHRRIRVGIGVHAGEVIEGSEGYVGNAVNVTARICALARAGEVLVSRTVRDLTRSGLMLEFQPRGSHRLKGIAEPVTLFAVLDREARPAAGSRLRPAIGPRERGVAIATVVGVLAFAVAVLFGDQLLGRGSSAETPSPVAAVSPDAATEPPAGSVPVSASASTSPGPFPNAAEAALRARLDPDLADSCRRADPSEAPRTDQIGIHGGPPVVPMPIVAGLRCELVLADEPDVVYVWHAVEHHRVYVDDTFFRFTSVASLPPGDCAVDDGAYGEWEFGQWTGNVACRVSEDDARIIWTYDGERIMGVAIRNDADSRALFRWWRDEARLLAPVD